MTSNITKETQVTQSRHAGNEQIKHDLLFPCGIFLIFCNLSLPTPTPFFFPPLSSPFLTVLSFPGPQSSKESIFKQARLWGPSRELLLASFRLHCHQDGSSRQQDRLWSWIPKHKYTFHLKTPVGVRGWTAVPLHTPLIQAHPAHFRAAGQIGGEYSKCTGFSPLYLLHATFHFFITTRGFCAVCNIWQCMGLCSSIAAICLSGSSSMQSQ